MTHDKVVVRCPHCRLKILASPTRTRLECPKCGNPVVIEGAITRLVPAGPVAKPAPAADVPAVAVRGEVARTLLEGPRPRPRFGEYVRDHWHHDQGGVVLKTLTALLSAALLSLLKPALGSRRMVIAVGVLAAAAAFFYLLYWLSLTLAYVLRVEPGDRRGARRFLAKLAFFGLIAVVFAWGPMVVADYFSPPAGWMVTVFPKLALLQDKLLPAGKSEGLASASEPEGEDAPPSKPSPGKIPPPSTTHQQTGQTLPPPKTPQQIEEEEAARLAAEKRADDEKKERVRAREQTDDEVIARLIKNLKDPNADTRAQAAQLLQREGNNPEAQAAVSALIALLTEDVDARHGTFFNQARSKDAALGALRVLAPEKVKPTLLKAAESKSDDLVMWAVDRLTEPEG